MKTFPVTAKSLIAQLVVEVGEAFKSSDPKDPRNGIVPVQLEYPAIRIPESAKAEDRESLQKRQKELRQREHRHAPAGTIVVPGDYVVLVGDEEFYLPAKVFDALTAKSKGVDGDGAKA